MHLALRPFPGPLPVALALSMLASIAHAQSDRALPSIANADSAFTAVVDGMLSLAVDPSRGATVAGITLQRDVGVLQLESGKLYFCRPVNGRTVAAVFVGTGTFRYRPPIDVEREQLQRFYGVEEMAEPFTSLVILFTDRTESELASRATFAAATVPDAATTAVEEFVAAVADRDRRELEPSFVRAMLNGGGLFFAQFDGQKNGRLYFELDPFADEKIGFLRRSRWTLDDVGRDDINRHHLQDEYLSGVDGADPVHDLTIDRYRIDTRIAKDLTFSARYDIDITMARDSVRWTYFHLTSDLAVDSLRWSSGEPAEVRRARGSSIVWVRNTKALARGERASLVLHTHGEPLGRQYNTVYLKTSSMWYPRHDFMHKAPFELTYTTPDQFLFASAGQPAGEPVDNGDGTVTSRWTLPEPSRNVSFNIGYFYETKVTPDSLPPIVVLRDKEMSKSVATQVAWDVENSVRFFQHLYGPSRAPYYSATQIPFGHGEAFPGLIHLSWLTFEGNLADRIERASEIKREGFNEFFRAHEVAHQWWGIGVDYASYHDQWISEGFASYSGLMYVQAVLKNNAMFFDWLRFYRQEIVDNRKSLFGKGQEAGPIWLGYRTNSSTTSGDYNLIIYKKGAWVLHMLRVLMIDPNTLSDEKYRSMMREFYASYAGRRASTRDFQRVAEKHAGAKLDWFFQQWIFGTSIPTYRFSHVVRETPDGKYLLKCRVEASDVPADFRSYPMLSIDFGGGRVSRGRRPVQGPRTEFELLLPAKPEKVIFNDFESVLCNLEEADWSE